MIPIRSYRTSRAVRWSALPLALILALGILTQTGPAQAQGTERLGDFGDWSSFRFMEDGNPACYMASQPKKSEGQYKQRGEIYALVTHRPSEDRRNEVSFVAGYTFKKDSSVSVKIGSKTTKLFTQADTAWAADKETDEGLVKQMVRGNRMVVKGTSTRGTLTTDTYSLKGFTKAHQAIDKACP